MCVPLFEHFFAAVEKTSRFRTVGNSERKVSLVSARSVDTRLRLIYSQFKTNLIDFNKFFFFFCNLFDSPQMFPLNVDCRVIVQIVRLKIVTEKKRHVPIRIRYLNGGVRGRCF